ncbi:hypothetical protein EU510_06305 [Pseudoalteromonas sp. FUC4]|jgi:hypothetical protein|uniref:ABC-three component system middle component 4 n=1 Tax=unclassified Pseudoalteromonas TaxID=194690 RepID=UPI0011F3A8CC|nr:ABC-three component system middle component 4 [Pseudoalteromonas sp. FUC4]KAA1153405.1 hypothetical protein EU510_06305 [Pseudoalteromonas sp. FUC4]
MKLPFINPENDLNLNLAILIIIVRTLSHTKRQTLKLNNERLHIYYFLVKNPVKLNKVMEILGKAKVLLSERNSYSIASISANLDPLFDREGLKSLLTILTAQSLVKVEYKKNDGFFYQLTAKGYELSDLFTENYFKEVALNCNKLKQTLSLSQSSLNNILGQIMRMDAF